jgi:hypothetical protein
MYLIFLSFCLSISDSLRSALSDCVHDTHPRLVTCILFVGVSAVSINLGLFLCFQCASIHTQVCMQSAHALAKVSLLLFTPLCSVFFSFALCLRPGL